MRSHKEGIGKAIAARCVRVQAECEPSSIFIPAAIPQPATATANPVLVEVTRGGSIESRHRGAAIVVDAVGQARMAWGRTDEAIFPRSTIKPMQAVALVSSGAAKRFALEPQMLAMAAASSFGEAAHVDLLCKWANRIGVTATDIKCGIHKPFNHEAAAAMIKGGQGPTVFHNNNCGKHLAFLTMAKHFGVDIAQYTEFDHVVQKYVRDVISAFTGVKASDRRVATEICGIPTEPVPIYRLAHGFARMSDPAEVPQDLSEGARAILSAMSANPELVSGSDRMTAWLSGLQPES